MRIIEDLSDFPADIRTVVTSGTFDGVHLGHEKILKQVVDKAAEAGHQSVVLTYWPHPRFVLQPDDDSLKLLSTFEEKARLLENCGIDYLVRIPFTKEFSQMEPDQFVKKVLVEHLNISCMVIGYDHHFGKDRKGNFEYLKDKCTEFGFEVEEISRHDIDDVGVSSTKIRNALQSGDVRMASSLLGTSYSLKGLVVHGDKKGTGLGFPTANLWVPERYKLIPAMGSYATEILWNNETYASMTNIGHRPTVDGTKLRIETNIFNFEHRLYGEELTVYFIERLRNERKFRDVNELKDQLEIDRKRTLEILEK